MTMAEWGEKKRCFCQSTNAVPAIARSAPPTRLEPNRRTGLNPSNINSNTPPRNPPIPTVNPRPTTSNTSFNSTNTTSSSSRVTNSGGSSRTQGSPSLSIRDFVIAIGAIAIAAALSQAMSAWFTAQLSQSTNNYTTQKKHQPQLSPEQVVRRYYELAPSNRTQAKALLSESFKEKYRQQNPNSDGKSPFWDSVKQVEIVKTERINNEKMQIKIKYIYKNGRTYCESQIVELIFEKSKAQWFINTIDKNQSKQDCGK
ncbi:MAG TPA: hypothetical protein DDW76_16495 [Cyanobacteria bacterium UBA11369]|nr:hypothetical protein [Cyanobacteria bacterium UBA11369]